MRDYEPYYTEDGSIGMYSFADKDVYHSKYGALTEAWEKFVLPSNIDMLLQNKNNIKVLDICYGIGYNTKALMSYLIKNIKIKKENFFVKIFKNLKNIFCKKTYGNETIYSDNSNNINNNLSLYNELIYDKNNLPFIDIDCLEINEQIIKLSPFFKTVKTPYEIFNIFIPEFLNCFKTYYKIQDLFVNLISPFMPHNKKDINDLLELKFKNMHIEKEYKVHPYVDFMLLNTLYEIYGSDYLDKETKNILKDKKTKRFFDKSRKKYARFNQFWGYNQSSKHSLSVFLHNIYYRYLSKRDKNMDFKTAQSLFNVSFYIDDARKSIKQLNSTYDCIFLDAFTYTKAPQLWTVEFIAELYNKISPTGVLLTYSNSAQVRNTLLENKFYVGKIYNEKNNKFIGTIASKDRSKIKYPLNNFEMGLCGTKAGIPYHDPNLAFENNDIIELREYEFRHSPLISSSKFMKLRGMSEQEDAR